MIVGQRTMFRFNQAAPLARPWARRAFSTAASDDYHSLDGQVLYTPQNPVQFSGTTAVVFDATQTSERRFVPWEIKEHTFKHTMGFMGTMVWTYMYPLGLIGDLTAAGFVLNWARRCLTIMLSTVRKIELHQDGKTVTVTPRVGSPYAVAIKDIRKLRHEKTLVETYEEAYLFPVEVQGKEVFLHGNGHESVKHGELFRAIINGQSIKL